MKRIKIQHDGVQPTYGTHVTNAETGEALEGVYEVSFHWKADDRGPTRIQLSCYLPVVDVEGAPECLFTCPGCGRSLSVPPTWLQAERDEQHGEV